MKSCGRLFLIVACLSVAGVASADAVYTSAQSGNPEPSMGPVPYSTSHWSWNGLAGEYQIGDATGQVEGRRLETYASAEQVLPGNPFGATATAEITIPIRVSANGSLSFCLNAVGAGTGSNDTFTGLWQISLQLSSETGGWSTGVKYERLPLGEPTGTPGMGPVVDLHETLTPTNLAGLPYVFNANDELTLWVFLRTDATVLGNAWSMVNFSGEGKGVWVDKFQNFSITPEPGTLVLLALGGVATLLRRRNRR